MRKIKLFILALIIIPFISGNTSAQAVGDYGSSGNINWNSATASNGSWLVCVTAGTWADATTTTTPASGTVNVWIRAGHTVTVTSSSLNCANLIVESGATLTSSGPLSSAYFITVNGSSIQVDGTFGGTTAGLGINAKPSGSTLTISGDGTIIMTRLRPSSSTANRTIILNANIAFNYSSGSCIYPQVNDGTVFEISSGKTVTISDGGYVAISTSGSNDPSSTNGANATFNIKGTLTLGVNSNLNLRNTSGKTTILNVFNGGVINVGGAILAPTATAGSVTITSEAGSRINLIGAYASDISKVTQTFNGTFDCANATSVNLGTTTISSTGLLRLKNSTFPTGIITFDAGSTAEYYGTSAYSLPATPTSYQNLTINNTAGLSLAASTTAGAVTLTSGNLTLGDYNLTAGSTSGASSSSYIVARGAGSLIQTVPASTDVLFPVGTASAYTPVKVNPASGSDFSIKMTALPEAAPYNTTFNADNWDISSSNPSATVLTLTASSVASTVNYKIYHWNNVSYDAIPATLSGNDYTATVGSFSPFTTGGSTTATRLSKNTIGNVYFDGMTIHNPDNTKLQVYDITGKKIEESNLDINMAGKAKGVYVIKGQSSVLKIRL